MLIRDATEADWDAIWPVVQRIVAAGDTYCWDPQTSSAAARQRWMQPAPGGTVLALDGDVVVGTAEWHPNQAGPGSHVAGAAFMVDQSRARSGVGRALGEHVLARARAAGFRAMQFNAVVETNLPALALWRSLGFEVLATVPAAFRHPVHGEVGLHILYRRLD